MKEYFAPRSVAKNGFAARFYNPTPDPEFVLSSSVQLGGGFAIDLGKKIGMLPDHQNIDCYFSSGSFDMHVIVQPVAFDKLSVTKHSPRFNALASQKKRLERLNQFSTKSSVPHPYAMMLEVDLMENEPPEGSLEKHFESLCQKSMILRQQLT